MFSFLILSSFVTPHIHRSIRISVTCNVLLSALFNAQVSTPYTSVLYTFPLIFTFIFSVAQHSRHSSSCSTRSELFLCTHSLSALTLSLSLSLSISLTLSPSFSFSLSLSLYLFLSLSLSLTLSLSLSLSPS